MFDLLRPNKFTSQTYANLKSDVNISEQDTTTRLQATRASSGKHSTIQPTATNDQKVGAVSRRELYLTLEVSHPASGKRFTEINNSSPFKGNIKARENWVRPAGGLASIKIVNRPDLKTTK
jgi:hypothetical protein